VQSYFTDVVQPCLPVAVANTAGGGMGMGAMGACCAAVKSGKSVQDALVGEIAKLASDAACLCPVGEILRFAASEKLMVAVGQVVSMCIGAEPEGLVDGLYVLLNSFFAPRCPALQQALDAAGNTTLVAAAAPARSEGGGAAAAPAAAAPAGAPPAPSAAGVGSAPAAAALVAAALAAAAWLP
jgi:hypothetical protein